MGEYEKYQELQARSQRLQEDYERQLQEMEEAREKALQELTEHYERKLHEKGIMLDKVCTLYMYTYEDMYMIVDGNLVNVRPE